jgi:DNA-binding GntR family transcriptional regulator
MNSVQAGELDILSEQMTQAVYRTKREVATDLLREAIIRGELAPGTRLMLDERRFARRSRCWRAKA